MTQALNHMLGLTAQETFEQLLTPEEQASLEDDFYENHFDDDDTREMVKLIAKGDPVEIAELNLKYELRWKQYLDHAIRRFDEAVYERAEGR